MSYQIPQVQKVAIVQKTGGTIEIKNDYPVKQADELAPGECLIKMEASGKLVPFVDLLLLISSLLQDVATRICTPLSVTGPSHPRLLLSVDTRVLVSLLLSVATQALRKYSLTLVVVIDSSFSPCI